MRICPTCKKSFPGDPNDKYFPFCSERCKLVDLGKWLDEEYSVEGPLPLSDSEDNLEDD